MIGRISTIIEIRIPGGDRYALYGGSPLSLLFLTSDENQLPSKIAAEKTAMILISMIKFSKKFPPYVLLKESRTFFYSFR